MRKKTRKQVAVHHHDRAIWVGQKELGVTSITHNANREKPALPPDPKDLLHEENILCISEQTTSRGIYSVDKDGVDTVAIELY